MTSDSRVLDALGDTTQVVDLHQHYWPPRVVELLRGRPLTPRIVRADGGADEELLLPGEPSYPLHSGAHDMGRRAFDSHTAGIDYAVQAPPCALGIEWLQPEQSQPMFDAWFDAARELPDCFGWWAWASMVEPDLDQVRAQLEAGALGVVVPATALLTRERVATIEPLLDLVEAHDAALFVHPGVAPERLADGVADADEVPVWLPAITDYTEQMARATVALQRLVRPQHRDLRVVMTMLGGLAPLQFGRARRRGAPEDWARDAATFYESSSFDSGVIEAVAEVVGARQVRYGTDAPVLDLVASRSTVQGCA